jgi:peptidoglycan DL-endopeptidase CwlO
VRLPGMARLRGARRMAVPLGAGLALLTLVAVAAGDASPAVASSATGAGRTGVRGPAGGGGAGGQAAVGETVLPGLGRNGPLNVDVSHFGRTSSAPAMPALGKLQPADLFVVAPTALSPAVSATVRRLAGVTAALPLDAARITMDGKVTATLGVDPAAFRAFAAGPTARAGGLWENVAQGGVALSYTMGKLDKVPLGRDLQVTGRTVEELPLAGLGTVGIGGVDAVVSDAVARSLGMPADNAIVISAPHADLSTLIRQIQKVLPKGAAVAPLVASGGAGDAGAQGPAGAAGLSQSQVIKFLEAAESRLGLPYVWGGSGPFTFDCSGLVQWSLAQAGVVMPRVAADQALTGPLVPVSELAPGDLLFYHTDPTAPGYISHVAIFLGDGKMEQAPEPGMDVEVVPVSFGSEFAGAIEVDPAVAASVAADPAG